MNKRQKTELEKLRSELTLNMVYAPYKRRSTVPIRYDSEPTKTAIVLLAPRSINKAPLQTTSNYRKFLGEILNTRNSAKTCKRPRSNVVLLTPRSVNKSPLQTTSSYRNFLGNTLNTASSIRSKKTKTKTKTKPKKTKK